MRTILILGLLWFQYVETNAQNVIAYYSGNAQEIDNYPVEKLTHIIYGFSHLRGNRIHIFPAETVTLKKLVQLKKKYPGLKVMIALGGWGGCKTCSAVFSTAEGRDEFARSVEQLCTNLSIDGIDIDWEFPAAEGFPGHHYSPADRNNLTALIRTLRQQLGRGKEISFLAAGFSPYLQTSVDWKAIMPFVDRVNLMTYDIIGSKNKLTGHHANLYSTAWQKESADNALRYLDSLGIPHDKIAIGAAFYAREFINVPPVNNGLHQPGTFKRFVSMKELRENFTEEAGFKTYRDEEAHASYKYNPESKIFLTYDDERSVAEKAVYVKEKKLNGIMFWELRLDKAQNGLLDEIFRAIK